MSIDFDQKVIQRSAEIPVVVQFTAAWCGPCKLLKPITTQMNKEREDFELVLVDVDNNPQIAMSQGIRSIPTLFMYKNGKSVSRYPGGFGRNNFAKWLDFGLAIQT